MKRAFAKSGNVEIAYTVEGEGEQTLLLIMGLGGRAADWGTRFSAGLAERYRVVRMDNRGVGNSPKVPGGYSLSDLASDAVAVLDAVGAERAHVCGISMGGMITQLVAIEHPDRVDKVVLMSTNYGGYGLEPPHKDALRLFDPAELATQGRDPAKVMAFTLSVIAAPGFADKHPEECNELVENARARPTHPGAFMAQLQAILSNDRSERVREIRQPTLVIHGTVDKLIPFSNGVALAERIPGARLAPLDGIGHMPMAEATAEVTRLIFDFLG